MEANSGAQMKDVGQGIGNLPALGKSRLQVEVLVAVDQTIEEQLVDALGIGVDPDAGIEIERAGLDDQGDGLRVRVGMGAGEGQRGCEEYSDD